MFVFQNRLLILLAAVLIAIAVFLVLDLNRAGREQVVTRFESYERLRAQEMARDVETYLRTSSDTLRHLAEIASAVGDDPRRLRADLQTFATPAPGFARDEIMIVDPAGGILYSTTQSALDAGFAASGVFEWAKKAENRGKVRISSWPDEAPTDGGRASGARLFVVTPYWPGSRDSAAVGQRWGGVVVMSLDLESVLIGRPSPSSMPDQHLGFWIMAADGTVLLQSDHPEMVRANVREDTASCLRCHVSFSYVERMIESRQGTAEYQLKGRPKKLAAFAPVAFANVAWIVVVNASQEEVTSYLQSEFREVLLLVGLLAVAFSLLFWSAYRSFGLRDRAEEQARHWQERHQLEGNLRRAEVQLRQAEKMEAIGTLAGGIAHDFNNMLSAIVGNAELMREELASDHPAQESISEIFKATRRATDLVRQILTFSRHQEQERRSIELGSITKEALKLLRATLPATIAINTDIADDAPPVLGDPTQIYQVIMNLAANAAYAMRDRGGNLMVHVRAMLVDAELAGQHPDLHEGPYVRLSIGDTGHGMDAATLERVFDPFFTTKPPGEGTGLGLAVVHGIIGSHDGAILVRSDPDVGTTFDMYFPVDRGHVDTAAAAADVPRGRGQRILFVDDEPALCRVAERELAHLGYEVEAYTSPETALEQFAAQPAKFDLVITDLAMPVISGRELASRILELKPEQPIMMMTGYSGPLTPDKARQLGLRAVLHKPLDAAGLGRAVYEVLEAP